MCTCVCTYVCVYVCVYIRVCVRVCVRVWGDKDHSVHTILYMYKNVAYLWSRDDHCGQLLPKECVNT